MVTVKIIGGLGNQMFCYSAGYVAAKYLDEPLSLDITDFYLGYFRQFMLDYFMLPKVEKIWHSIDEPVYSEIVNLPPDMKADYDLILDLDIVANRDELFSLITGHKNVYLHGYGGSHLLGEEDISELREHFIPRLENPFYTRFLETVQNEESVAVHVRRTDFLRLNWSNDATVSYYEAAMCYMRQKLNAPIFYIFSDDISWTKEQFDKYDDCRCVNIIGGDVHSLYEMLCMSACRHHILTKRSTFGKWACMLSEYRDGINLSDGTRIDFGDCENINIVFFDEEMIEKYSDEKALEEKDGESVPCESVAIKQIEEKLLKNEDVCCLIDSYTFGKNVNLSESDERALLEYKAISYLQEGCIELAIDVLRTQRERGFVNSDFYYNYGMALSCAGHHLESLCYATIAGRLCPEFDIASISAIQSDEERQLAELLVQAYDNLVAESGTRIVFKTAYADPMDYVHKHIISIAELLKTLGFDTYIWRKGIDADEVLDEMLIPGSIEICNLYDTAARHTDTKQVAYMPCSASDADRYFGSRYSELQWAYIKLNSDVFVGETEDENSYGCILCKPFVGVTRRKWTDYYKTEDLILTWDKCVNDDEMIWGMASVLRGIQLCTLHDGHGA